MTTSINFSAAVSQCDTCPTGVHPIIVIHFDFPNRGSDGVFELGATPEVAKKIADVIYEAVMTAGTAAGA